MSNKNTEPDKKITMMTSKTKEFFNILYPDNNVTGNELRNILERSTATTQCNNTINPFNQEVKCWLCGEKNWNKKPITKTDKYNNSPECEHKLPVLQAFFVIGELYWDKTKNYGDKIKSKHKNNSDKTIKEIRDQLFKNEYAWSHRYCNQKKSDKVFIKDNGTINNKEIKNLLGDIYDNFITKPYPEGINITPSKITKINFINNRLIEITKQLEGLREHYNAIFDKNSSEYSLNLLSAVSAPDWQLRVGTTKFPLENFTLNKFGDFYKKITKEKFYIKLDEIINKVHDELFNEIKPYLIKNIEQLAQQNSEKFFRSFKKKKLQQNREDFIKNNNLIITDKTKNELYDLYLSNDDDDDNNDIIKNLITLIFYIKLIKVYEFGKDDKIQSFINNKNLSNYINKISEINEFTRAVDSLLDYKNNSQLNNTRKRQRSSTSNTNTRKRQRYSKLNSDIYTGADILFSLYNRNNSNSDGSRSKSNSNSNGSRTRSRSRSNSNLSRTRSRSRSRSSSNSNSNSNSGRITRKRLRINNSSNR